MTQPVKGSCLCQTVKYQYTGTPSVFQHCHCSRCRKFTGSAHGSNIIVGPDQFEWLCGEESLGRYEHPDAKHFATSFCQKCGSSLPWITQNHKAVVIPAGTLDDDPGVKPKHNIYWKSRVQWRDPIEGLPQYDELPTA
jgi:hypothetical protein